VRECRLTNWLSESKAVKRWNKFIRSRILLNGGCLSSSNKNLPEQPKRRLMNVAQYVGNLLR
jgi:hypothetical protein